MSLLVNFPLMFAFQLLQAIEVFAYLSLINLENLCLLIVHIAELDEFYSNEESIVRDSAKSNTIKSSTWWKLSLPRLLNSNLNLDVDEEDVDWFKESQRLENLRKNMEIYNNNSNYSQSHNQQLQNDDYIDINKPSTSIDSKINNVSHFSNVDVNLSSYINGKYNFIKI